jgi:hypothetical protein
MSSSCVNEPMTNLGRKTLPPSHKREVTTGAQRGGECAVEGGKL